MNQLSIESFNHYNIHYYKNEEPIHFPFIIHYFESVARCGDLSAVISAGTYTPPCDTR